MKNFDDVWLEIMAKLRPGDVTKNWGNARGYTGGTFKIDQVTNAAVLLFGGRMTETRSVSKGDFEKVYALWDQYVEGNYPRAKMTGLPQNMTYILSILRKVIGP